MEPRCAVHPDRPAAGTCQRCGAFACAEDLRPVGVQVLCSTCAARPDGDYLEAFRLRYWGKRDAFTWVWAGAVPLFGIWLVASVLQGSALAALVTLALMASGIAYFFGPGWARRLVFAWPAGVMAGATSIVLEGEQGLTAWRVTGMFLAAAIVTALPLLVAVAVYRDGRNQLFFKVPLSREKLQRTLEAHDNSAARVGFLLSLVGLLMPGLSLLGVVVSAVGLSLVNPAAKPPVGRKGRAIAGVVVGILGVFGWILIGLSLTFRGRQ